MIELAVGASLAEASPCDAFAPSPFVLSDSTGIALSEEELKELFAKADIAHTGTITFDEFAALKARRARAVPPTRPAVVCRANAPHAPASPPPQAWKLEKLGETYAHTRKRGDLPPEPEQKEEQELTTVMVTIPEGHQGDRLKVRLKTGQKLSLPVPQDAVPGSVIKVVFPTPAGSGLGREASVVSLPSQEAPTAPVQSV